MRAEKAGRRVEPGQRDPEGYRGKKVDARAEETSREPHGRSLQSQHTAGLATREARTRHVALPPYQ